MKEEYLARMKQIAFEGGKIALTSNRTHCLKSDDSILTKADVEISRLAHIAISDLLKTPDHILIDEEDTQNSKYLDQSILETSTLTWVIDPIDGTRAFSNGMPNFGISIGLLKNLKPWLGLVYFPMLGELFYSDGEKSFFVQNAFTEYEKKRVIMPIDQQITSQSSCQGKSETLELGEIP